MQIFAIVVSLAFTLVAAALVVKAVRSMWGVLGQGQSTSRTDNPGSRTLVMLKETVLHTRMLQWTWVGALHWFAFAAFIALSTAVGAAYFQLFDVDFAIPLLGQWFGYEWIAEGLGLLGSLAIIPLIIYRLTHTPAADGRSSRFFGSTMWQAYFVEAMVLLESCAILFIRGAEFNLLKAHGDDHATGFHFPIAQFFGHLYPTGQDSIGTLENIIWVIATIKIVSAMIWLIVIATNLTMGVAWHRFTAWFNIWFKRESSGRTALGALKPLTSDGKPITLDDIDDLDEDSTLGVGSIEDFSWKGILDFTTCTECGRCQSQCPAWNTEKPLSPKLLMMGLREHAYAKAAGEESHTDRALIGSGDKGADHGAGTDVTDWFYNPEGGDFVIDEDVLWSCTTCGACVQQCPVDIEHVDHIVDMRRYQLLVEANFPSELNQLFKGLENKGNPWNMSPNARLEWAQGLDFEVPVLGEDAEDMDDYEWLFWVGCAGAYEDRAKKTTRAVAELLNIADVKFAVLGNGETCTGDPARRAGNEFVFQGLATQNAETFKEMKVKKVVSTCAHCFNTLKNEYRDFGVELEVVHHTQLLNRLVREKRLAPVAAQGADKSAGRSITYHDPCYLGRHNQVYSPPRELLQVIPDANVVEMERNSEKSFCCGAGGARMWMEENLGERINVNRTQEAVGTGADQIAVGCPFCRVMLADGLTAEQSRGNAREEVEVLDVAQLLLASVKGEAYQPKKGSGSGAKAKTATAGTTAAGAASADVATKADPSPEDATVTPDTVTSTEDAGPAAKASGGSSLFDTPADGAPAESGGGSLFDTPADTDSSAGANDSSDSSAPAQEKPASSGGSLFDVGGDDAPAPAETASTETASAPTSSETKAPEPAADSSAEPAQEIGGGSLFDLEAPAETPAAAEPKAETTPAPETESAPAEQARADSGSAPAESAPEQAAPAEPADEIGSGSLFDIAAPAEPAPTAPEGEVTEAEPAGEPEQAEPATAQADAETEQPEAKQTEAEQTEPAEAPAAPASSTPAPEPASEIGNGSLFDIAAPEPAATAAPAPSAPDAAEASETSAVSETTAPTPAESDQDQADAADDAPPEADEAPVDEDEAEAEVQDEAPVTEPDEAPAEEAPVAEDEAEGAVQDEEAVPEAPTKSLHDIKAEHEARESSAGSSEDEPVPAPAQPEGSETQESDAAEPEATDEDTDGAEAEAPKPASSGEAHQPATDKDIGGASSLFDL